MEHLNRLVKTAIQFVGANKTPKIITRVGQTLRVLAPMLENFDGENGVTTEYGKHRKAKKEKDMAIILNELSSVFTDTPGRLHRSFPNPRHPLHEGKEKLKKWIVNHVRVKDK